MIKFGSSEFLAALLRCVQQEGLNTGPHDILVKKRMILSLSYSFSSMSIAKMKGTSIQIVEIMTMKSERNEKKKKLNTDIHECKYSRTFRA